MSNENPVRGDITGGPPEPLKEISDIRRIMARSSRFISLSGLSGIAAGICGIAGAYIARSIVSAGDVSTESGHLHTDPETIKLKLVMLAVAVLAAALIAAFIFTWRRAKQNGLPVWDLTSRKLTWNVLIPLIPGGLFILAMLQSGEWRLAVPASLIFYGLGLVNGSKYTLSDIRYLGFLEIVLGLINTQFPAYSLYFWTAGFGVLHIVYGTVMWWKYEKPPVTLKE